MYTLKRISHRIQRAYNDTQAQGQTGVWNTAKKKTKKVAKKKEVKPEEKK